MASLELRGDRYRIVFRHAGVKYQHPLGTVGETDARACLKRLEANLHDARSGRLGVPAGADLALFLVSNGAVAESPRNAQAAARPTVGSIMAGYLTAQATAIEPNSLRALAGRVRRLETSLGVTTPLEVVTQAQLQAHIERRRRDHGRRGRPVITRTIVKEIFALNGAWRWAVDAGLVTGLCPSRGLRYPRSEERPRFQTSAEIERRVARGGLTEPEISELWDCLYLEHDQIGELVAFFEARAKHRFLKIMVALGAYTGMRRSEMLRARAGDVDLDVAQITVREKKRVKGTSTTRIVPLSTGLARTLRLWLAAHPGGTSLLAFEDGTPVNEDQAAHQFIRTRSGSPWARVRGFHVLRHSFISACASRGVDMRTVQAWCGHMSPEMSSWYTHLSPATQRAAMDAVFE